MALDSSVLNDISRDYFHNDSNKNKKARNIINSFYASGGILVITWHHIEELLAHKNDNTVNKSIDFIRELPIVASIVSDSEDFMGSIMHIEMKEINNILEHSNTNLEFIIKRTRENIFNFSSGNEFIEPLLQIQPLLRSIVLNKVNHKREVVSISRAESLKVGVHKLSDLKTGKLNSPEEANLIFKYMERQLANEIKAKGDKKISSADTSAKNFLSSVNNDVGEIIYSPSVSIEDIFLKNNNISNEEYEKLKNWEEFEYLSIFKERLKGLSKDFSDDKKNKVFKIEEKKCPTWLLWKELYKIRIKAERVSGSDINDAFLSGLCMYVDLTIVDKRTHEYLFQIKQKNDILKPLIGRFEKFSNYSNILDFLPEE